MTELQEIAERLKTNMASKIYKDYGLSYEAFICYLRENGVNPIKIRNKERRRVILEMPHLKEVEMCDILNCERYALTKIKRQLRSEGHKIASFSNNPVTYFG